jgi:hypothetical protein
MRSGVIGALAGLLVLMAACEDDPEPAAEEVSVSVLERPGEAGDELPLDALEAHGISTVDEEEAGTARLARSTDAHDYYVLEQRDAGICLAVISEEVDPMVACGGRRGTGDDGVVLESQGPHGTAGIAIDGVEHVDSMAVEGNVFIDEAATP